MVILYYSIGPYPLLNIGVSQGSIVGAVEIVSGGIMELDIYYII